MPSSPSNSPPSSSARNAASVNRILPSRSTGEPKPKIRRVSQSPFLPTVSVALPFSLASDPTWMCVDDILNAAVAPKYDDDEECAESQLLSLAGCLDETDCADSQFLSQPSPLLDSFPALPLPLLDPSPLPPSLLLGPSPSPLLALLLLRPLPPPSMSFELESAAVIAICKSYRPLLITKEVKIAFNKAQIKGDTVYFIFDLQSKDLPFPKDLGVRLLSLKTGNGHVYRLTTSTYKFCYQITVLVPKNACSLALDCTFDMLCFYYKNHGDMQNSCYRVSSTFSLTDQTLTSILCDPPVSGTKGKLKSVSP